MWYGSSRATARRLTWFCPGSFVDLNLNQTRVYRDGGESVCGKSLKTVCVAYDVIFCMFYSEDQAKKKKRFQFSYKSLKMMNMKDGGRLTSIITGYIRLGLIKIRML